MNLGRSRALAFMAHCSSVSLKSCYFKCISTSIVQERDTPQRPFVALGRLSMTLVVYLHMECQLHPGSSLPVND